MKSRILSYIFVSALISSVPLFADAASFSRYLTVGSTGSDVSALQTWLIDNGYSIKDIISNIAVKGRFGSQTKAAVKDFQKKIGLPSTGYVGPLTTAWLNKNGSIASSTSTPLVTQVQQIITTPGVSGTLALTLQPTPADNTLAYKGQSVDIATYKAQAANSDMAVQNISLDFSDRLWLYASNITIKNQSGSIVGKVDNLNSGNFSEITVGSSYRTSVPVSNYVVKASQTDYLTVTVSFLPVSDRTAKTISLSRFQTRSIDGVGATDTQTISSARTFSYQGMGNGILVITANKESPPNMLIPISTSVPTDNIVLGVADFNSQGVDSTLRKMNIYVNTSTDNTLAFATIISDVKIKVGDKIYSADSIGSFDGFGYPIAFTNLSAPLPKNTLVPVAIMLRVNPDTNNRLDGISASSTFIASGSTGDATNNPLVEDASLNPIDINDAPLATSDITFSVSDANMFGSDPVATLGTPTMVNNRTTGYSVQFKFSVTAGNNTLYMSSNPAVALSTTSTGFNSTASSSLPLGGQIATLMPGDSNITSLGGYYVILPGVTRQFAYSGSIDNTNGPQGLKSFGITSVNYGTTTANLSARSVIYYNYPALKVNPLF